MARPNEHFSVEEFRANPLRVRWMDPTQGRFLGLDAYAGNQLNPISFNKYLYCHADPVNNADPTGRSAEGSSLGSMIVMGVANAIGTGIIVGGGAYALHLGLGWYQYKRNQSLGLPTDWPIQFASDPGDARDGEFKGVPYILALYPGAVADDSTFKTIQRGCYGLLRVRLGIQGLGGRTEPWTEVSGTRGFTDFNDAYNAYRQLAQNPINRPLLYVVQRNPNWPAPINLGLGTSEVDVGPNKIPMPGSEFNFATLLHANKDRVAWTWEDMPNGISFNSDLMIKRTPFDPWHSAYGLKDPIYDHAGHSPMVFFVSPSRNTEFRE